MALFYPRDRIFPHSEDILKQAMGRQALFENLYLADTATDSDSAPQHPKGGKVTIVKSVAVNSGFFSVLADIGRVGHDHA